MGTRSSGSRAGSAGSAVAGWVWAGLAITCGVLALWVRFHFGSVALEEVVLSLPGGAREGIGNNGLGVELAVWLGVPLLVLVGAGVFAHRRRGGAENDGAAPRVRPLLRIAGPVAFLVAFADLAWTTGVPQYLISLGDSRSIAAYHVQPSVARAEARPKNLVTIYLESMENTFSREDLFGQNLLAVLDGATSDWVSYDGMEPYPDGGYTMAGLVATQCGIPLKSDLIQMGTDPNMTGQRMQTYLPGAHCLGDVLSAHGYTSEFIGGADDGFAGKHTFLVDHGYGSVKGLQEWLSADATPDQVGEWGLSDAALFDHARTEVDRLHASGQPFNLTMLTVDTHEPAALYPDCPDRGGVPMARAITCSLSAVAGFVDHLRARGYLQDTVVVIMGDHLKQVGLGTTYASELSSVRDRTILLRVWSPDPVRLRRDSCYQFSMLATSLDLIGLHPPQGRAGVGVSLTDDYDLRGTALALPAADYLALLAAPSRDLYRGLWAG